MPIEARITLRGKYAKAIKYLAKQANVSNAEIIRLCMQRCYGIELENVQS